MEGLIAGIWREMLGVDRVGSSDKFFDLGGNSLLSMRVITRIKKETGFEIRPRDFIFLSLGQIAAICEGREPKTASSKSTASESRKAFFFGEEDRKLFGCFHPAPPGKEKGCAVVLCYPVGQEYIRSHRTFVQMAVQLSHAGFPVLRFDYFGTGDSAGDFSDATVPRWRTDIERAIEEIRKRARVEKVCLCGLRLGGAMAMMAGASAGLPDSLILWNPVVNGKSHIEELLAIHKDALRNAYTKQDFHRSSRTMELLGYAFTENLVSGIRGIDLPGIPVNTSGPILLVKSGGMPHSGSIRTHLFSASQKVEFKEIPGPNVWMEDPYQEIVQQSAIRSILDWLNEVYA